MVETSAFQYAMEKLKQNQLDIPCAIPSKQLTLDSSARDYEVLFRFSFQKFLNQDEVQKQHNVKEIEQALEYLDQNIEHESRREIFQKLNKIQQENFAQMTKLLVHRSQNFELLKAITYFLIAFRRVLQVDSFHLFSSLVLMLRELKFSNIFKPEFRDKVQVDIDIQ